MKALLFLLALLMGATAVAAAAPPDPLLWIWQHAWPKPQPNQKAAPVPTAKQKATRSIEHRKVHRPPPRTVKAAPAAAPLARPTVKKQRAVAKRGLPSCATVKSEYDRMTVSERWSRYLTSTSEEVAHGRRCLGM